MDTPSLKKTVIIRYFRNRSLILLVLLCILLGRSTAYAYMLTPQYAGIYLNGDGANSRWVQVVDGWRGPTYGSETWGTGIWSLADQALVLGLESGNPDVIQVYTAPVPQINFGDQRFINEWGTSWSTPQLAPIFNNTVGEYQDNWGSRFWGYIAITTPGAYNFGILYDDGFQFALHGAGGNSLGLHRDGLNSRDRLGFDEDLHLTEGLYAYSLDAYERLEAGVVQLAWWKPGANDWALLPREHLFTRAVAEPATTLLIAIGLAALGWRRHTKR